MCDSLYRGTQKTLVGGYNGGVKGLVSRANNAEKVGGICKTENLTAKKEIPAKIIEGREILVHMAKTLKDSLAEMSHSERYDARREHLKVMSRTRLPWDYMDKFAGKHFLYESINGEDNPSLGP